MLPLPDAAPERGPLFREYTDPRSTFSLRNWPFLALLVFLAFIAAWPAYRSGNPTVAILILAIGGGVVLASLLFLVLWGRTATTLLGLYENGAFVHFRGADRFIPWSEVTRIRSWTGWYQDLRKLELADRKRTFYSVDTQCGARLRVGPWEGGEEVLAFIADRSPRKPVPANRYLWWLG